MCFGLFYSKIFFKAFALSFPHQQMNQYCQQLIPEEGRHSWEALSIMSPVGYCLNILETLPNLLTVLSSESRKQIQFSLLIVGLFRSPAAVWKGLMETCLPLRAVAAVQVYWGNRQKAGGCFSPVPLRCNPATGQLLRAGTGLQDGGPPLILTADGSKHSCHSFFVVSIACSLALCYCISHDATSLTLYSRNSFCLLTQGEFPISQILLSGT